MEIPDLVRSELGDEELLAGVPIGDEEIVCGTPTRTLVYRSEGLLSDEGVTEFSHNVDRVRLSKGRRKTKFLLDYVDGTESFAVPADATQDVLTLLLEGILRTTGVLAPEESVVGAFRFSELTLVVAEQRLVRHIGETVWDEDFETYPYSDLTDLAFEEGNVATELVIAVEGRPQRVKTPRDDARLVEETVKKAVFEFYDVTSIEELRSVVAENAPETDSDQEDNDSDDLGLGSDIDPLVGSLDREGEAAESIDADAAPADGVTDAEGETTQRATGEEAVRSDSIASSRAAESADGQPAQGRTDGQPAQGRTDGQPAEERGDQVSDDADQAEPSWDDAGGFAPKTATASDVDRLEERLDTLSDAVKRQNQLLKKQHKAIEQLVEELRKR